MVDVSLEDFLTGPALLGFGSPKMETVYDTNLDLDLTVWFLSLLPGRI